MFKIEGSTFHVTRKESRNFDVQVDNYEFTLTDKLYFRIYEANGFEDSYLLEKSIVPTAGSNIATFAFTSADTDFGGDTSEVVEYWYEIKLNNEIALAGYDTAGPKIFTLYPTGKE